METNEVEKTTSEKPAESSVSTESSTPIVKTKKKMKLWKKILIGIGIFIVLIIWLANSATSGIVTVAEKQLNLISSGDLKSAYALTSQEFQRAVSYDRFVAYVNNYEVLKNYKERTFNEREVSGSTGTIKGTLTAKDGTVSPVEYKFIEEKEDWKILSIDLDSTGGANTSNSNSGSGSQKTTTPGTGSTTATSGLGDVANPTGTSDMVTFSDSEANLGYSIQYPKDWTAEKKDAVTVLFSGPKEKDQFDVTLNIQNLAASGRGGSYTTSDDVIKDLKNQIKAMDKNATFSEVSDIPFKRADGMDITAKSFATKFKNQGKDFMIMQIVAPHGDNLTFHTLGYTAPTDKFEKNLDLIKSILDTWQLNK